MYPYRYVTVSLFVYICCMQSPTNHMYVCIYIYVIMYKPYVYLYLCMYLCTCHYLYINVSIYLCDYVSLYVYIWYMQLSTNYMYVCMYVCMYVFTYHYLYINVSIYLRDYVSLSVHIWYMLSPANLMYHVNVGILMFTWGCQSWTWNNQICGLPQAHSLSLGHLFGFKHLHFHVMSLHFRSSISDDP